VADPVFLATAVEIVLRAGEIQLERRASGFRVQKKGAIDLVTEVDFECEHMCRAILAERFPDHDVLAVRVVRAVGHAAPVGAEERVVHLDELLLLLLPHHRERLPAGDRAVGDDVRLRGHHRPLHHRDQHHCHHHHLRAGPVRSHRELGKWHSDPAGQRRR